MDRPTSHYANYESSAGSRIEEIASETEHGGWVSETVDLEIVQTITLDDIVECAEKYVAREQIFNVIARQPREVSA